MPGLAQHAFGVSGGVGSPVEMAIGSMHVSVLWRVLGKMLLGCGRCLSHAQQGRHNRLVISIEYSLSRLARATRVSRLRFKY